MSNSTDLRVIKDLDLQLLVVARIFAQELSYPNYPIEWSRSPLSELLPLFAKLLDVHSAKLGSIILDEYNKGHIGRISVTYPQFFEVTKQYHLDMYEAGVMKSPLSIESEADTLAHTAQEILDRELMPVIVHTFARLSMTQENEHRALEAMVRSLANLEHYLFPSPHNSFTNEMIELVDYRRQTPDNAREAYAQELSSKYASDTDNDNSHWHF